MPLSVELAIELRPLFRPDGSMPYARKINVRREASTQVGVIPSSIYKGREPLHVACICKLIPSVLQFGFLIRGGTPRFGAHAIVAIVMGMYTEARCK